MINVCRTQKLKGDRSKVQVNCDQLKITLDFGFCGKPLMLLQQEHKTPMGLNKELKRDKLYNNCP